MEKIYYNKDGWVCNRHPNNFEINDEESYIEVDEITAEKTFVTRSGYAWRIVDGKLVNEVFDQSVITEQAARDEMAEIESWFTNVYDTQVKQYNRCQRLGIEYDNKYGTIAELDEQATINAKRISELRKKYSIQ